MSRLNVKPRTIFCRDNLDILKGMNSECVDLIYLDPPFNKKKTFAAPIGSSAEGAEFKDIFREEDVKDEWVDSIERDNHRLYTLLAGIKEFGGLYNYCYCVWMAIRLMEIQRILKSSGSLYLHCDQTMSHYLKLILDCIFREKHFRNEVIWHYFMGRKAKRFFSRKHDTLFFYTKSSQYQFNPLLKKRMLDFKPSLSDPFKSKPGEKGYVGQDEFGYYSIVGMDDVWDIKGVFNMDKQWQGYPTQKPIKLLERLIAASSHKGDLVLDPFCGCATTCVAAEKLERTWIGIDVSQKAYELVKMRLAKEVPTNLFRGEPNFSTTPPKRGKEDAKETGYVYIMKNELLPNQVKVGVSKNPESRAKSVMAQAPKPTEVVWKYKTIHYREIEHYIHQEYPREKEWVTATIDEIKKKVRRWKPAP